MASFNNRHFEAGIENQFLLTKTALTRLFPLLQVQTDKSEEFKVDFSISSNRYNVIEFGQNSMTKSMFICKIQLWQQHKFALDKDAF